MNWFLVWSRYHSDQMAEALSYQFDEFMIPLTLHWNHCLIHHLKFLNAPVNSYNATLLCS